MNTALIALITQFATIYHINPKLAIAIVEVESHFNVHARGLAGEIGLMQVMPSNAKHLTQKELFKPETNIAIGMALLAEAHDTCPHQKDYTWITCYNLGTPKAKKLKHPGLWPYYKEVMKVFKHGQRIAIDKLMNNETTGLGIYLSESKERGFKGYHRVLVEGDMIINIELCRLSDEEDFFNDLRKKYG